MKVCSHCKVEKPLEAFVKNPGYGAAYRAANREKCNAVSAAWRAAHRERAKATHAAWYVAHRERAKATATAYRAAHREKEKARHAAYGAAYYSAHREKVKVRHAAYRAANPEKVKAASATYRAAHREKVNAHYALRRARKRGNGPHEKFTWVEIAERDGWRCQLCGIKLSARLRGTREPRAPVIDHIVPLSKGGTHVRSNVQLACWSCNAHKGTRIIGQLRVA